LHRPKESAQGRSANYGQLADVALGVNRAVNVKGLALGRLSGGVVYTRVKVGLVIHNVQNSF